MTHQQQELASLHSTLSVALMNLRGARVHLGELHEYTSQNVDGWAHTLDDAEFRLAALKEAVSTAMDSSIRRKQCKAPK